MDEVTDPGPNAPSPTALRVRRALAGGVDVALFLFLLLAWGLPFTEVWSLDGVTGGAISAPTYGRGGLAGLTGSGVTTIGLGLTGLVVALQVPFTWRAQTLGLSLLGLDLRVEGRRASIIHLLPWAVLTWSVWVGAVTLAPMAIRVLLTAPDLPELASAAVVGVAGVSAAFAVLTGRGVVDRMIGATVSLRRLPEASPAPAPTTGWAPREGFRPAIGGPVDPTAHRWRQSVSYDPLNGVIGPSVGAMPEASLEPEHVEHVDVAPHRPSGGTDGEEDALAQRLRRALADQPDSEETTAAKASASSRPTPARPAERDKASSTS